MIFYWVRTRDSLASDIVHKTTRSIEDLKMEIVFATEEHIKKVRPDPARYAHCHNDFEYMFK